MPPGLRKNVQVLDPKLCFDLWVKYGSVYTVSEVLYKEHGIYNTNTGRPVTHMGVWDSAWRYILNNLPEAREKLNDSWKNEGKILTDAIWFPMVIDRARRIYSDGKFRNLLRQHPYLTPYINAKQE